jgi:hypothetical protein
MGLTPESTFTFSPISAPISNGGPSPSIKHLTNAPTDAKSKIWRDEAKGRAVAKPPLKSIEIATLR